MNTSNPASLSILTNDDVLSTLTQHQRINLISLSNEKNKIKSLNMDYIALTENDLRGQDIGVEDGSTELTLELYNFMYKNSRSGITLSDAEYNAQAKKRAELEATMFAMLMASNLTGNANNNTKVAEPPVTKSNTGKGAAEGAGDGIKFGITTKSAQKFQTK